MPGIPPTYRAVIVDQQVQLARLVRIAGIAPVRALYADMLRELERRLGASTAGTFDHQRLRGMVAQIRLGMARLARGVAGAVEDGAEQVGIHAARTMLLDAAALEHHFTGAVMPIPLLQAARLKGLVEGKTESVMRVHETSMARYGVRLVRRFEGELGTALSLGESQTQAIDRIQRAGALEWSGAERIVRTEMSFAASASAREAADEQAEELDGDLWSRWTEHVSDDGAPLDERVGVDSEAMHGQVAPPGGMFTQPPASPDGEEVGDTLIGRQWVCPPNRPNDRAVLVPWRASWGIPGWRWEGRRVPVTADHVERTNERWMRKRRAPDAEADEPDAVDQIGVFGRRRPAPPAPEAIPRAVVQVPREVEPGDDAEPAPAQQMVGPGFYSPIPKVPSHAEVSAELERTGADGTRQVLPAKVLAQHGWHEPDAEVSPAAVDDELRAIREGVLADVDATVAPSGAVVVDEGREKLHAAAHAKAPVAVTWSPGPEPGPAHVHRREPAVPGESPYRVADRVAEPADEQGPADIEIPAGYERFEYNGAPWVRHPITGKAYPLREVRAGHVFLTPIAPRVGVLRRAGRAVAGAVGGFFRDLVGAR